jgi:hypothetical protein
MELQEAVRKYPDFWLYGQAMIKVAQDREARGIYLSAEDCYHLAKALHPVRSNAGSTRTTNPEPIAKPSRRAPASAERPGVSPQSTTQTKTTLKEAMEQAWESTMGRSE